MPFSGRRALLLRSRVFRRSIPYAPQSRRVGGCGGCVRGFGQHTSYLAGQRQEKDKEFGRIMIPLNIIIPTQDFIRNTRQIPDMVKFVKKEGYFTEEVVKNNIDENDDLIRLTQFEDGKLYLSNGHHRLVAMVEAGRKELHEDEFYVERMDYSAFSEIVFERQGKWLGWVTPHDPRIEVRMPNLESFKYQAKFIYNSKGKDNAINFVNLNKFKYCKSRKVFSVEQLHLNYIKFKGAVLR